MSINLHDIEAIATMQSEDQEKCHRAAVASDNFKSKMRTTHAAAKSDKIWHLDAKRMNARYEMAQANIESRDAKSVLIPADSKRRNIFCTKSGMFIGSVDMKALAIYDEVRNVAAESNTSLAMQHNVDDVFNSLSVWQSQHAVHPVFFNTSPEMLQAIQKQLPHEYIIYTYTYLIERHSDKCKKLISEWIDYNNEWQECHDITIYSIPAIVKHELLTNLYNCDLRIIVEIAELIRMIAAFIGKNKALINQMPALPFKPTDSFVAYRDALLAYIRKTIKTNQKRNHARHADRARFVTNADIKRITGRDGIKLFQEAKINLDDDNPMLKDIAEIFADAGMESAIPVRNWREIQDDYKKFQRQPQYDGKLIKSESAKQTVKSDSETTAPKITIF